MGTDKLSFVVVLCGGATGSHVTGSDVSHVPCPEVCSAHALPGDASHMPGIGSMFCACNRKLRNIRPSDVRRGHLSGSCPDRKNVLRMPGFPPAFFS
jgi:hypothetical protein